MSAEECCELHRRTPRTLRQLALIFVCAGVFACGEDVAPPPLDDDERADESSTAGDDKDAGASPQSSARDSSPAQSGGAQSQRDASRPQQPEGPAPSGPKPLLDAATEQPSSDAGSEPFDPGDTPADASVPREDLGAGDGKDVVTIGDSWMSMIGNGDGIEGALRRAGKRYRNYGVPATTLSGQIPGQYTSAKRAGSDIKTVIMTGGGNDIMFSGACNSNADACANAGAMIVMRLNTLWTQMANDGVKDIVYIQYASSAGTSRMRPDGGASGNATVPICASGKVRCHSIPTSDLVSSRDLPDGIHPNQSANDRIAKRILETMTMRGVRR